jgi:hypothetical protein
VYYGTQWAPDGETFYFSRLHPDSDDPSNGIWALDRATNALTPVALATSPDLGPLALLEVSPAGDTLLGWYPMAFGQFAASSDPLVRLIDLESGAIEPIAAPGDDPDLFFGPRIATFSPDGAALLQLVNLGEGKRQIWVTDLVTGEATLLIEQLEGATAEPGQTPSWAANGTVLVSRAIGAGYLFPVEGIGLSGSTAPVASTPVSTSAAEGFAPGADAFTRELTPIYSAPNPNATVVLLLVPNQIVQILGEPVENEFGRWYSVIEPDTQTIGYVQENRLGEAA